MTASLHGCAGTLINSSPHRSILKLDFRTAKYGTSIRGATMVRPTAISVRRGPGHLVICSVTEFNSPPDLQAMEVLKLLILPPKHTSK